MASSTAPGAPAAEKAAVSETKTPAIEGEAPPQNTISTSNPIEADTQSQPQPQPHPHPQTTEQPIIEHDPDHDSVYEESSDVSSYATSLLSSVRNYTYENGRRYHTYREGAYVLPNDEAEQDRQDLLHHVRNLTLGGKLFLSPLPKDPHRVLDIGTGTGIWAIDFADQVPSAEVIGTDLSPIQPAWVPPNLFFQVEDAEAEWVYNPSKPFDFIHMRDLGGAIGNWEKLVRQAKGAMKEGGWIEIQEFEVTLRSDDETMKFAPNLVEYLKALHEASKAFGKVMNVAEAHKERLVEAGYVNVRDEIFKVPSSGWPKDPQQKEIGRYNLCSLLLAVESYALALFTRVLGWSNEETQVFLVGVRADLKSRKVHSYCNLHIVYGQKPLGVVEVSGD